MKVTSVVLASLVLASWCCPVAAQTPAVTLQSIVLQAIENHPNIEVARARLQSAGHNLEAAEQGRFPSLAVGLAQADNDTRTNSISLTQPLWTWGRLTGEIEGGEYRVNAAQSGLREAELQLAEQVVQLALDIERYRRLGQVATSNVQSHEELRQVTQRRAIAGAGSESDLVLATSRTEQAKANTVQVQVAGRRAEVRLAAVAGVDAPSALAVENDLVRHLPALNRAIEEASQFSPTVHRLTAEAQAAGSDAVVAESRIWPQLGLKAENIDRTGKLPYNETRAMVTLEYQPGAGMGAWQRKRAADAQQRAAQMAIERAKRELKERISADLLEAQSLSPRIAALENAVQANEQLVASFLRQFTAGKRSWVDVLNAQNEYATSRQTLEETRFAALSASYRVLLATGRFFEGKPQ